jgi:hypothetical protein
MRTLSHGGTLTTVTSPTGDSGSYRAKERVIAGYAMEEFYLGEHTVLVPGVRIEGTDTTYSAPQYTVNSAGAVLSRSIFAGDHNYVNVMPGVHLREELFRDTPLRISYSRSLARPNYSDLAPFATSELSPPDSFTRISRITSTRQQARKPSARMSTTSRGPSMAIRRISMGWSLHWFGSLIFFHRH